MKTNKWIVFVLVVTGYSATAIFSKAALASAETQKPKRAYGFDYRVESHDWDGQSLKEIKVFDEKSKEMIDQIFVIRLQDLKLKSDLKFRNYEEADRACAGLRPVHSLSTLEHLETKFAVPLDHLMFFLIDEDLVLPGRPILSVDAGSLGQESIYPFWTQGPYEPSSISTFKMDSSAGYLVGKSYTSGFIFGFPPTDSVEESERKLTEKLAQIEKKREAIRQILSHPPDDLEDYIRQAHAKQMERLAEQVLQIKRELSISKVQREGLELYCVAGGRLDPMYFLGPLNTETKLAISPSL